MSQIEGIKMILELKARIGEDGNIVFEIPTNLPQGEVEIVITYLTDEEKADETLWQAQFDATPPAVFEKLIDQGLQDYQNGETDEFDPTQEDD
jgi:hypothetical protein